jgi:hypothetical protein
VRALFWFLVLLAVLAVGADRVADHVAERVVASQVRASQDLPHTPDVDITGFPFLTQLARQHLDLVTASTTDVRVGSGDRAVTLSRIAFTFRDVRANRDFTTFVAATGSARATLPYAELSRVLDLSLSYAGDGRIKAGKKITVAGQSFTPSISIEPALLDGAVDLTNTSLDGSVPAPVAAILRRAFERDIPLSNLPFDVRATSLRATPQGIVVRLVGRNLSYQR